MAKEKNKTELPKVMEGELQTRLIKLREDAGFDTSQMADALCLSEEVIINLENEAFDLLAEPPYVRGYLRNYAKLGDEDASELINRYEALRGADAAELDFQIKSSSTISTDSKKRISPVWGQVILLAALIGGLALIFSIPSVKTWAVDTWQSFSSQLEPSDASKNPSLLGDLPVPSPLPEELEINTPESVSPTPSSTNNQSSNTASDETNQPSSSTENISADTSSTTTAANENTVVPEAETTTAETATPETESAETPSSDTQEVASTSTDGSINIKLMFNKEVWLRIKDKENKTVFEGLNKADTEKTITLMKNFISYPCCQ